MIRHTWFNIGEDRLSRLHIWNSATTETLLTQTDPDTRPDDEYIVDSLDVGLVALRTAISRRQTSFELILTGEAAGLSDALVAELAMMTPHSFRYSWNDAVGSLLIGGPLMYFALAWGFRRWWKTSSRIVRYVGWIMIASYSALATYCLLYVSSVM